MQEEQFRQPHFLQPNHHRNSPSYICCVDTEAQASPNPDLPHTTEQRFRLGTATRCRIINGAPVKVEHLRFDDPAVFWDWLHAWKVGRATTWLFAHNLGYDLTLLGYWKRCEVKEFYFVEDDDFRFAWRGKLIDPKRRWHGTMVIDDPPTILCWRRARRTFRAVDTINYWPMSLADLGRHVGITKQFFPGLEANKVTLSDYCANDTAILFRAVLDLIRWWTAGDYGKFGSTSAALAWSAFRHKFYSRSIHIHGSKAAIELERAAYYGGRVECFYCGPILDPKDHQRQLDHLDRPRPLPYLVGPVHVLDVQSAYPAVMRHCLFPCRLLDTTVPPTIWDFARRLESYGAVAHVSLKTERAYPLRKETGEVSYPVGEFQTTLAGPELSEALADGSVRKVHACAWYEMADLFSGFVGHFWAQKHKAALEGDTAQELFVKTILNSLYGKFAQRKIAWEDCADETHSPPWDVWYRHNLRTGEIAWLRSIAGRVQKKATRGEWWDSFPAIAAYVTSYLRVQMERLRQIAGERNVYYMDTDSLHCNTEGLEALWDSNRIVPGQLGALRHVAVHQSGHYYGLKHYELDGEVTQAGISSKAEVTREGTVLVKVFERTRSIVSRSPDGCVRVQEREITRSDCHPRGVVGFDGWVKPQRITGGNDHETESDEDSQERVRGDEDGPSVRSAGNGGGAASPQDESHGPAGGRS